MPDQIERAAKFICAVLAVLLLIQFGRAVFRRDPLSRLTIPALPSLRPETNAPAMVAGNTPGKPAGTGKTDTNTLAVKPSGTNAANGKNGTNGMAKLSTTKTNPGAKEVSGPAGRGPGAGGPPGMAMMGMGGFGGPANMQAPELPLPVRARVYGITDSEILGPVMHPLPTALLGIVGEVALVRAASGQSGVVKEGENVGALKLLKIGTNRVLVEEDGKTNELTIFSGYGGDSLMPKQKENSR
jgi:hypothetical protein